MKWHKILFGTFLLAFFSLVGFSSSVYAVDDVTHVFSSSDTSYQFCYSSACDGYKYIYFYSSEQTFNSNFYMNISYQFGSSLDYQMDTSVIRPSMITPDSSLFVIPTSTFNRISVSFTNAVNMPAGYSVTVLFTDTLQSLCPEPDPCPEPEQCPEASDTPYSEKFDNIEKAIYTCGAILIMLYFFYCIYRMIIKGSGVN